MNSGAGADGEGPDLSDRRRAASTVPVYSQGTAACQECGWQRVSMVPPFSSTDYSFAWTLCTDGH